MVVVVGEVLAPHVSLVSIATASTGDTLGDAWQPKPVKAIPSSEKVT